MSSSFQLILYLAPIQIKNLNAVINHMVELLGDKRIFKEYSSADLSQS